MIDYLEQSAIDTIDEIVRAQMRTLAAETGRDESEQQAELRQLAYGAVAAELGDSPLASATLSQIDFDTVVDEICRIDTIEIPSPCCGTMISVRTKGGLVARETGSFAIETLEHECSGCHRRYAVAVETTVAEKGHGEATAREFAFELLPEERVVYSHREHRSNGCRSSHYFWHPREDGTPVLARREPLPF